MKKNVCMFVWNHFTNDARVLRECTALSEQQYSVDLICIADPSDPNLPVFEERNPYFRVHRVRRYPILLDLMKSGIRYVKKHKPVGALAALAWLALVYFFPIIMITLTLLLLLLLKTKLQVIWVRGGIIMRMIRKGRQKDYDIYHSNDLNTLPQGYVCAKWRLKKRKLIYDSHEVQTSRTGYGSFQGKMEGFLIKKMDEMIVENHTRAKFNEELYGFYPHVLHNYPFKSKDNSTEKAPLHEILGLHPDEKILLYQGGIQAGRGLEKLVEAVPLFKEGTLVFIGDGKIKPQLEKMVKEKGLQDKVKFLPKVPVAELPKYTRNGYLGFQVLNNTNFNHYSASSNKLFEYMMAGVPVIACSFPEIQKVVETEKVGICVDSHDYEDIARGVNELLAQPALREELHNNCLLAKDKYNWENEKENYLRVVSLVAE
jgi:glycosyltransferase involved in cell wall biosynthesis